MKEHLIVPDVESGYELSQDSGLGYWSIIKPEFTRNLVVNPSFERDLYQWFKGDTPFLEFERTADISIQGAHSVRLYGKDVATPETSYIYTPLEGWDYNKPLTLSAYGITTIKATNSRALRVGIVLKQNNIIIREVRSNPIKATSQWFRVECTMLIPDVFRDDAPDNTIELRLYHGGGKGDLVYWDGVQAEYTRLATTYCDGDMVGLENEGFSMYCWDGAPHRSTSVRSPLTRSGGRIINLSDVGFRLMEFAGVGMPQVEIDQRDYGMLSGMLYRQSLVKGRDITLSGFVCGENFKQIRQQHYDMLKLLSPDVSRRAGLNKWLYAQSDCCDDTLEILAAYSSGMEGDYTSLYQSRFAMQLSAAPFFREIGERGQSLEYSQTIGVRHILQRYGSGQWDNLDGGVANLAMSGSEQVYRVLWHDNSIIAYGNFDTGGNPTGSSGIALNKLASFSDDGGWFDIFSAADFMDMSDKFINDLAITADGRLIFSAYDTGLMSTGVYSTDIIAARDCVGLTTLGNLWTDMPPKTWYALAVDRKGYIYAGGDRGNIEYYDGTMWQNYLSGFIGTIRDMATDADGRLVVVGQFKILTETPTEAMETLSLFVAPSFDPVAHEKQLSITISQVAVKNVRVTLVGDVSYINVADSSDFEPDDPITDWDWEVVETGATATGQLVYFDLNSSPMESIIHIELTVTTTNGKTLTNDIVYYKDGSSSGGDDVQTTFTEVRELENKATLKYTVDLITITPNAFLTTVDDPIIKYLYTNDFDAQTITTKEGEFDFALLPIGDTVVITLQVTTLRGGVNINSISLVKQTDVGLEEDTSLATANVTQYQRDIEEVDEINDYYITNGVIIIDRQKYGINGLPSAYCVDIAPDGRLYIGTSQGLWTYNGGEAVQIANIGKVTSVKISKKTGEVYVGGTFGLLKWTGNRITSAGISTENNAIINSIDLSECDDALAIGMKYKGGVKVNGATKLHYSGSAETRPSLRFFGPGRLYEVANNTLNQRLYFDITMQVGEIIDMRFGDGVVSLKSSYWGNLPLSIGTRSDFFLAKGDNDMSVWIDSGMAYCSEALAIYQVNHITSDALCSTGRDLRYPVDMPESCCPDGRTLTVGDRPNNDCWRGGCAIGSTVIDIVNKQVWILGQCESVVEGCNCDPQPTIHVDDTPDDATQYNCVPGTTVINPITKMVYILASCDTDCLEDSDGEPLFDSDDVAMGDSL